MAVGPNNTPKLRRTTIDPRRDNRPDGGFAGTKKSIAPGSFKEAFAVAFAKKPGGTFTYKGKKYLAARKGQGKGPSKSRVEDKVSKADIMGNSEKDTNKRKVDTSKVLREDVRRKTRTNAAGQRMGQRKAGGMIKKYAEGGSVKKAAKTAAGLGAAIGQGSAKKKKKLTKQDLIPQILRPFMKDKDNKTSKKKKMAMGGMAMKYKHGGKVGKKCPRDGIAMKGKTRA